MGAELGSVMVDMSYSRDIYPAETYAQGKKYLCKIFKSEIFDGWGVLTSVELQWVYSKRTVENSAETGVLVS